MNQCHECHKNINTDHDLFVAGSEPDTIVCWSCHNTNQTPVQKENKQ